MSCALDENRVHYEAFLGSVFEFWSMCFKHGKLYIVWDWNRRPGHPLTQVRCQTCHQMWSRVKQQQKIRKQLVARPVVWQASRSRHTYNVGSMRCTTFCKAAQPTSKNLCNFIACRVGTAAMRQVGESTKLGGCHFAPMLWNLYSSWADISDKSSKTKFKRGLWNHLWAWKPRNDSETALPWKQQTLTKLGCTTMSLRRWLRQEDEHLARRLPLPENQF